MQKTSGVLGNNREACLARGTTSVVWTLNICRRGGWPGRVFWENISDLIPAVSGVVGFGYKWPLNVLVRFVLLGFRGMQRPLHCANLGNKRWLALMAKFICGGW